MTDAPTENSNLRHTPLHTLHIELGARMVPFAGYDMPVQYPAGVLKEHLATRASAGLFDVSHMGQIAVRSKSGDMTVAARALEQLVPVDVLGLAPGRQRYAYFTNTQGGLIDDLMIANRGDHFLLVVNAACKDADLTHLTAHLAGDCTVEPLARALIAVQGPSAETAVARLAPACRAMRFMDVAALDILGAACVVSRSGYTGEDGFEISMPEAVADTIARAILSDNAVQPIGLGARDSLRLEAGLCLYGSDINTETTPVEADIAFALSPVRRTGGARAGGFPGADIILAQLQSGTARRRVGLRPEGRAPVRGGTLLYAAESGGDSIGSVTSGGFGPSLDGPLAMGYVPAALANPGTRLFAEVRGKRLAVTVAGLPFVSTHYRRGSARPV